MDVLTNPVILFFIFGIGAGLLKSNLEVPQQIAKFLSLYLLMAIGLKGGFALNASGINADVLTLMLLAVGLAIAVPLISYRFLCRYLDGFNAAGVAATYGSISAVTFVTATQFLAGIGVEYSDYMAAAMAMMEAPAIVIAIFIANQIRQTHSTGISTILRESFTEGANLLLIASLIIGMTAGPVGASVMKPFTGDLFTGLLAFFLLDMGLQVAKRIPYLKDKSPALLAYAIIAPVLHSLLALGLCLLFGIDLGNTVLLMVLAASASYIAVPAALKESMPEASPSVYLGLSLGVTFPFNVIVGIPLYYWLASYFLTAL